MADAEDVGAGAGATGEGCVVSDGKDLVLKFAKSAHFSIVEFGNFSFFCKKCKQKIGVWEKSERSC